MSSPALPPARRRVRQQSSENGALSTAAISYLSSAENYTRYDSLRNAIYAELTPVGVIERLWVDDIVELEWEAHRLRTAKKAALDLGMRRTLDGVLRSSPMANTRAAQISGDWVEGTISAYLAGDQSATRQVEVILRHRSPQTDLMGEAYLEVFALMAGLEKLLLACDSRRDALLANLYGQRELLRRQRARALPSAD